MTDHAGHIRNPLTVISRFAAVAEISGTAVLPFIAPENQATYIWFLMLFPTLLVGTFFLTLNFNHKTLYAPSDYQNQNHFLNLFGIVTPDERSNKLSDELKEAVATPDAIPPPAGTELEGADSVIQEAAAPSILEEPDSLSAPSAPENFEVLKDSVETKTIDNTSTEQKASKNKSTASNFNFDEFSIQSKIQSMQKLADIEKRAIHKLYKLTRIPFKENVKFDIPDLKKPIIFDAIADKDETIHIAEVKFYEKGIFAPNRFSNTILNASIAAKNVYNVSDRKVLLHLVVVVNKNLKPELVEHIQHSLTAEASKFSLPTKVYVTNVDQLMNDFIPLSLQL